MEMEVFVQVTKRETGHQTDGRLFSKTQTQIDRSSFSVGYGAFKHEQPTGEEIDCLRVWYVLFWISIGI